MADFAVPGTWTFNGSNGSDQSTYRVTGHTTAENYLVVFDRKFPQQTADGFTKPSCRVRVIRTFIDTAGKPLSSKALCDVQISWPISAPVASVKAMVTLLGTIFSDVNIASDFVDDLRIPLA